VKRAVLLLSLAWALAATATATAGAARDPRLERLALQPRDVAAAKHAVVQRSDLPAGWRQLGATPSTQAAPDCPGYRPDFSKFTITGQAETTFASADQTRSIASRTEVYASRSQARGDFALGTAPAVARCLGVLFERALTQQAGGIAVDVLTARRVAAPRVGERSAAYRIVVGVGSGARTVDMYVDVAVVLRGRSIGAVFFTGAFRPVPGRATVLARVAARLR
jgi:hypothetical protein